MKVETIEETLRSFAAEGLEVALTPTEKVRMTGPRGALQCAADIVRARREEFVAYLRVRPGDKDSVDIGDTEPITGNCPRCGHAIAPAPHIQIENFRIWQRQRSEMYQWTDAQLARLERMLEPFDLIVPDFALSCTIRRGDGSVRTVTQRELSDTPGAMKNEKENTNQPPHRSPA